MSFTFPNPFRPSHQPAPPEAAPPVNYDLPPFDHRQELSLLPYDMGIGKLAERAVQFSGAAILKQEFGVTDDFEARTKATYLAGQLSDAGYYASYELYATESVDDVWQRRAVKGDDAMLTLLSLKHLANARDQGFYAARAADVLAQVHEDDTRISLK